MKVLMINGSPHEHGCTYTALKEVAGALEKRGIASDILHIGTKPIAGCIACRSCANTGKCVCGAGGAAYGVPRPSLLQQPRQI